MHILIMSLMIGLAAALDMFYNAPTDKKEINMNTLTAGFFIVVFATGLLCLSLQVSLGLTVVILLVLFVLFLGGLFYIKKNK